MLQLALGPVQPFVVESSRPVLSVQLHLYGISQLNLDGGRYKGVSGGVTVEMAGEFS